MLSSLTLSGTTCKNLLIFSGKKTGQLLRFSYSSGEVNASLLLAPRQQSQGCVWGTISEVSRKGLTGSCLKQSSSWCLTEYITITGWLSSLWRFAFKLNYLGSLVLSHSWKGLFKAVFSSFCLCPKQNAALLQQWPVLGRVYRWQCEGAELCQEEISLPPH